MEYPIAKISHFRQTEHKNLRKMAAEIMGNIDTWGECLRLKL